MNIVYLLIPVTLTLVVLIAVILMWAVRSGQFDDLEGPAYRILMDEDEPTEPVPEKPKTATAVKKSE